MSVRLANKPVPLVAFDVELRVLGEVRLQPRSEGGLSGQNALSCEQLQFELQLKVLKALTGLGRL